ncbi:ESX secretion-associated protein EspG [Labedaea rhizosphaerae]|uniref:ESAT-6 protein secretion system EspG family protein n=1 Tax=Labedaea rhizosphaerae TaxID=598644 RepID=A0A4R6S4I3_LABRH|nr:ESX secretion-associated protein EspG [Labedaea rhizosphaerae]TDP93635.1 ESAT-6 protein secretion system EspG family protein [Labedaea rhizosphaerae]
MRSVFAIDTDQDPADPVTLTALEFDVLWQHLDLGPMPLVLKVPSPGKTELERARLVRQAWDSLGKKGLGRQVDLDDELVAMLRLLSRPEREVDGRLWLDKRVRVLAASREEHAVLAVLSGDELTLSSADATGLARYAMSVLPEAAAGPGHSVTMRSVDFEAAAKAAVKHEDLADELQKVGLRKTDADVLGEMIGPVQRQGQFGAAARDKWGKRVRFGRVLSFFDTKDGRYLQLRSEDEDPWITISPVDHRRLRQHLVELHEASLNPQPKPPPVQRPTLH